MWAAANTNNVNIAKYSDNKSRLIPVAKSNLASGKSYGSNEKVMSNASTLIDDEYTDVTPRKSGYSSKDLEMQKMATGVVVDRTYSVRSD